MSLPQTSKSRKNVQFKTKAKDPEDSYSDSDSVDLIDSTKTNEPDYYDPVYFDSDTDDDNKDVTTDFDKHDEDQDDDEMEYDIRAGISSSDSNNKSSKIGATSQQSTNIKDITKQLGESSLESPKKISKKNKKHPTIPNEELFYDPEQDDKDQEWLIKKIAANRPPGCNPEDIWTDAILSCPMCLTQLCYDCQQHEFYPHQFRAMFVENCRILENEVLRFPKEAKKPSNKGKNPKSSSSTVAGSSDFAQGFKPSVDDDYDMTYHPVACEICNTRVALIDQDEIFHFFNVIPDEV